MRPDVTLTVVMEIQELLARLDEHDGSFPTEIVAELIARQDEAIPILLNILEQVDSDPEPWLANSGTMQHIYALYLLALFRETRAHPLIVRIFSQPGEFVFDLAGDVVTQDLGRILASVSGGDMSGMAALIENEQANEYVRWVAMGAMTLLVLTEQRTRAEVMDYLVLLFEKMERTPGAQWDGLADTCADLWPKEAMEQLRRAYADGLIDPRSIEWEDVTDALALGQHGALQQRRYGGLLITDVAKSMGWMQCFHKRTEEGQVEEGREPNGPERLLEEGLLELPRYGERTQPVVRTAPKIGRNEPCPCGSGKKFKRCCGAT